eukprot:gene55939-18058_t
MGALHRAAAAGRGHTVAALAELPGAAAALCARDAATTGGSTALHLAAGSPAFPPAHLGA